MTMSDARNLEQAVADILTEMPQGFNVGNRRFYIYPVSLGKSYLLSRLTDSLEVDAKLFKLNPCAEALRLTLTNVDVVCRIIALHTMRTQDECHDVEKIERTARFFAKRLSAEEVAQLFALTLADADLEAINEHLGINADNLRRKRVMAAKKEDRNTFTFGGNSVFGAMIAPACEKLNLTPRQVVWDISLKLLRLLLADSITQVYLTDEERKHCRVSNDNERINGDDPAMMQEWIRQTKWD